jgi:hypothetical protein
MGLCGCVLRLQVSSRPCPVAAPALGSLLLCTHLLKLSQPILLLVCLCCGLCPSLVQCPHIIYSHGHSTPQTTPLSPIYVAAATALIAHKVTADTTLGAEVVRDLANGTTTFATGECRLRCWHSARFSSLLGASSPVYHDCIVMGERSRLCASGTAQQVPVFGLCPLWPRPTPS